MRGRWFRGAAGCLGIIVENITNPFFPELIQSFEEIAVAHGYEILVSSSNSDPAILTSCVRRMLERKVDGVAVMTFGEEESVLDQLIHRNVPIVLAEFRLDDPKASTILLDYSTGIRAAVNHLAELGHRGIAFLAGPHSLHSAVTRENDFRTAMQAAGLPVQKKWVIECDHTLKGGVAGFGQLQKLPARPTAIVCSNDMTAIGVLRAAYMEGLRVPQDVSVIGLDDIDFAEFTLPPLTTIRLSRGDLARAAFEALRAAGRRRPRIPKCSANFWSRRASWFADRRLRRRGCIKKLPDNRFTPVGVLHIVQHIAMCARPRSHRRSGRRRHGDAGRCAGCQSRLRQKSRAYSASSAGGAGTKHRHTNRAPAQECLLR